VSRRDNAAARCPRCLLHKSVCLCALVPTLETRTRLMLVIHRDEERKPTNTGALAVRCLSNSELIRRGEERGTGVPPFSSDVQPLLLFPHEDARPLADFVDSPKPISLVVPDGTWRQASKVRKREAALAEIPCVTLPAGAPSIYRLRREPREGGLATMEAIARAFGVLEGQAIEDALMRIFRVMVDRTLWIRGQLDGAKVTGGLPEGATREAPSGL